MDLPQEIQRQFKEALGVVKLADNKLDAVLGIGSAAKKQVVRFAEDVVAAYIRDYDSFNGSRFPSPWAR